MDFIPQWMPGLDLMSQIAHFGWGGFLVLAVWLRWGWKPAFIGLVAWTIPKEFGFDLVVERDSVPSGMVDASFYFLGGLSAWVWVKWNGFEALRRSQDVSH